MVRSVMLGMVLLLTLFWSSAAAGDSDMTEKEVQNKNLIEWIYVEGVNKQNPDAWDSVLSADYVRHCDAMPPDMQEIHGIETMKEFLAGHFVAFPDWHEEITQIVVQGDRVAMVTIGTGTMTGQLGPFAPTNKKVREMNIMIHRIENGNIAETWITWDNLNFMNQAGLTIPGAGGGKN